MRTWRYSVSFEQRNIGSCCVGFFVSLHVFLFQGMPSKQWKTEAEQRERSFLSQLSPVSEPSREEFFFRSAPPLFHLLGGNNIRIFLTLPHSLSFFLFLLVTVAFRLSLSMNPFLDIQNFEQYYQSKQNKSPSISMQISSIGIAQTFLSLLG